METPHCPSCETQFNEGSGLGTPYDDPTSSAEHDTWCCTECGAVLGVTYHG